MQNFQDEINDAPASDASELSYYLEWQWPQDIETALRRMLWIALVEAAEPGNSGMPHTHMLRKMIASYHEAPPEVLHYIATISGSEEILLRIAENPQTRGETLSKLVMRGEESIQAAAADNPLTPAESLLWLTKNACADVRHAMAENSALPAVVLQELCFDDNVYVAERAKKTLSRRKKASVSHLNTQTSKPSIRKAM